MTQSETPYMKKIEYIFYNEAQIRELVTEAKNKVALSEIRNSSHLSDPTAAEAIRNLTPITAVVIDNQVLKYPEYWLEVVERTRHWCRERGELFYKILRAKYCRESKNKICTELEISADYFGRTVDKIRNYAALWAAWYRLIAF